MHRMTKYRIHIMLLVVAVFVGIAVFLYETDIQPPPMQSILNSDMREQAAHNANEKFVAHKALYDIKLASTHSGSQVVNIAGQMYYEWRPTCDAWLTDHRFNMLYEYTDAPPMHLSSNFSTYESFDGKVFNFSSQRKSNGEVFEEIRGSIQDGVAKFRLPEVKDIELPEGTLFPVAHTIEVARQILSGKRFFNAVIFDGSDMEGAVQVNSFIGDSVDPTLLFKKRDGLDISLLESPAKKVRLAFFPLNSDQITADYEMDLIFHENGVISDMSVEYDDFSVTQKLVALEKIPSQCEMSP